MQARWVRLWRSLGASEAPRDVLAALLHAYTAPDRHYHTLSHLQDCLQKLDDLRSLAGQPLAVEMALWFHDAVYDTHAHDNEARSAQWAGEAARRMGLPEPLSRSVQDLVLATQHDTVPAAPDAWLIADIDLSILGENEATFRDYERNIRREYAWVDEESYRARRAAVLQRFRERDRIYQTEPFFDRYEAAARCNLEASLLRLHPG